ncbi:MAG: hypothetical protein ACR2GC_12305 [Methyloceanibacter sp.]|uniref:hypothetical protein n=1 Tax=Methyloceanibacter sp. TaxID=1965321 RepID=UPI003D9B5278
MRLVLAGIFAAAAVCAATNAQAERRMFIIANDAGAYGVDQCLAGGEKCGAAIAHAYCKSHEFAEAASFKKVDRDDITGSIPTGGGAACHGTRCDEFVAIVCTR